MGIGITRSIPFPRIHISRIVEYINLVAASNGIDVETLKERRTDIGKGKGDITRFLEKLGVVAVKDGKVYPTDVGRRLQSLLAAVGPPVLHRYMLARVPLYSMAVDILNRRGSLAVEEYYDEINRELSSVSPTAWINRVAFRALLGMMGDVGFAHVRNGRVMALGDPLVANVRRCVEERGVKIGGETYVSLWDLRQCLYFDPPQRCYAEVEAPATIKLLRVDVECAAEAMVRSIWET